MEVRPSAMTIEFTANNTIRSNPKNIEEIQPLTKKLRDSSNYQNKVNSRKQRLDNSITQQRKDSRLRNFEDLLHQPSFHPKARHSTAKCKQMFHIRGFCNVFQKKS